MKLPKGYFSNLSTNKYKEYLKLLPAEKKENARIITTLILTFFAMSFFGIFAIKPTLVTIATLKKQLADSKLIHQKLNTKITTLSSLQQQYTMLQKDLPHVFEAIPTEPDAPLLTGQILGLANKTNVTILSLTTTEVQLTGNKNQKAPADSPGQPISASDANHQSYSFSLQAQGSYENLMNFSRTLTQINRLVNIDSLSLAKDAKENTLTLGLNGRVYFQK